MLLVATRHLTFVNNKNRPENPGFPARSGVKGWDTNLYNENPYTLYRLPFFFFSGSPVKNQQ